ncbi:hypothetical protein DPMN_028917 [Dreissena polymorpha]|uniref:Uncharacterized protein n=1 Tax=Dreissena polymorpha TaxID=45954 RepID=A0A9D4RFS6_DREPO|nr:hypothetical protein DPMN_028917 [Dreissena polymorpha]
MVENGAELGCVVRGQPNKFNKNDVTVTSQDQLEHPVPFGENEELVSYILLLQGHDDKAILKVVIILDHVHYCQRANLMFGHIFIRKHVVLKVRFFLNVKCQREIVVAVLSLDITR